MSTLPSSPASVLTPASAVRKGWFERNWKWFVPTGCLTLVLLAVAFVGLIVSVVMFSLKHSDPYKRAVERAQSSSEVTQRLGTPVEPGWYATGSINVRNSSGDADISIPISGPKGKATVHVVGLKESGQWQISTLNVAYDGSEETTDLLQQQQQVY